MGGKDFGDLCFFITWSIESVIYMSLAMQLQLALGILVVYMEKFEAQVRSHCNSCGCNEELNHIDIRELMVAYSAREACLGKFTETFALSGTASSLFCVSLVIATPIISDDAGVAFVFVIIVYFVLVMSMFIYAIPAESIARVHNLLNEFPLPKDHSTLILFLLAIRRIQSSKKGVDFYGYLFTNSIVIQRSWNLAFAAFFLYGMASEFIGK